MRRQAACAERKAFCTLGLPSVGIRRAFAWAALLGALLLSGCANGGGRIGLARYEDPGIREVNLYYNWNLGVHIPTKFGNILFGTAFSPIYFFIEAPINAILYGKLQTAYTLKYAGSLGGLIFGSLALPIALLFPRGERPSFLEWYPPFGDLAPEDYGKADVQWMPESNAPDAP